MCNCPVHPSACHSELAAPRHSGSEWECCWDRPREFQRVIGPITYKKKRSKEDRKKYRKKWKIFRSAIKNGVYMRIKKNGMANPVIRKMGGQSCSLQAKWRENSKDSEENKEGKMFKLFESSGYSWSSHIVTLFLLPSSGGQSQFGRPITVGIHLLCSSL